MTISRSSKHHIRRAGAGPGKRTGDRKPAALPALTCTEVLASGAVCGKKCYRNRKEAKRAAAVLYPGQTLHFYTCGGWHHMTSSDAGKSERTRRELAAGRGVFDEAPRQRPAVWPGQPREET